MTSPHAAFEGAQRVLHLLDIEAEAAGGQAVDGDH
jgi:hypothetical protein